MKRLFGQGDIQFSVNSAEMEGKFLIKGDEYSLDQLEVLLQVEENVIIFDAAVANIVQELITTGIKEERTLFNILLTQLQQVPVVYFRLNETANHGIYNIQKAHLSPIKIPDLINLIKATITELDVIPVLTLIVTKINATPDISKDALIKFLTIISAITENVIFSSVHNAVLTEVSNLQSQIRLRIVNIAQKQPTKTITLNVEALKEITIDFDYTELEPWQTVTETPAEPLVDIRAIALEKAPVEKVVSPCEPEDIIEAAEDSLDFEKDFKEEEEEEEEEEEVVSDVVPEVTEKTKVQIKLPTITLGANNPIIPIVEQVVARTESPVVKEKEIIATPSPVKTSPILLINAMPYNAEITSLMDLRVIKLNMEFILDKGGASHYAVIGKFNDNGTNRVLDMLNKSVEEIVAEVSAYSGYFSSPSAFTDFFVELFRKNKWQIIYGIPAY